MLRTSAINLVLKIGLSIASLGFAILSFLKGTEIVVYFPRFIVYIFGETVSLILGALIAVIMTVWLMSRQHKFAASFTYTILIGLGMLFNLTSFTFISIAWPLFCMSLALSLRYYPRVRVVFAGKDGKYRMKIVPAMPESEVDPDDLEDTPHISKKQISDLVRSHIEIQKKEAKAEEKVEYGEEEPFLEDRKDNDIAHKYPVHASTDIASFPTNIDEEQLNAFDALGPEPLAASISESDILTHIPTPTIAEPIIEEPRPKHAPKAKAPRVAKPKKTKNTIEHSPLAEALQAAQVPVENIASLSAIDSAVDQTEDHTIEAAVDENPRIAQKRRKARASKKPEVEVQ